MTCPRDCRCNACGEVWRAWVARRNATRIAAAFELLCEASMVSDKARLKQAAREFVAAERGEL